MTLRTSAFALSDRLAAKAVPALIADDDEHFARISQSLGRSIAELSDRLDSQRRAPGGAGQQALQRDQEIHRLSGRLRTLRRYGIDLCLGRMVSDEHPHPVYVGRLGLTDQDGQRLLVDWRSPAAEPFFGATHANPMGLASRRRYRWTRGRISDYWDEVFGSEGLEGNAALDDQSAFIASLGGSRSNRMRDVLGTIQSDQDAIIRAGSRGALVVDGGPGTGKTVVALHRAAYLLYSEPRIVRGGGVLFVGPHQAYLAYVDDVLPSLGEESVQICTLRDLVVEGAVAEGAAAEGAAAEGAAVTTEANPEVAALKSSGDLLNAVQAAVAHYEQPPKRGVEVETPWANVWLGPDEWAEAFDAADPSIPHNEAREQVWEVLVDILLDRFDGDEGPRHLIRRSLLQNEQLTNMFAKAWPLLDPVGVVADLWSVPSYLQKCAPWLTPAQVRLLQRQDPRAWTRSDLPFLDAARQRIGDPNAARRKRQREAELAAEREQMDQVVDDLIAADDSELKLMSMLRGRDSQNSLVNEFSLPVADPDVLGGPFAHIVVDEAQELTDAEWRMLLSRCPSHSLTIVGDRAQARHGFTESWQERLERLGLTAVTLASLSVNYRTPSEVMGEAEPVIRSVLPDANVPTSVRSSGIPVRRGRLSELDGILDAWLDEHDGVACVIGAPGFVERPRVRSLTPELSKGLEFDLVVVVDPGRFGTGEFESAEFESGEFGTGIEGAVDGYVAMTRATQQLVILTS